MIVGLGDDVWKRAPLLVVLLTTTSTSRSSTSTSTAFSYVSRLFSVCGFLPVLLLCRALALSGANCQAAEANTKSKEGFGVLDSQ